MKKGVFTVANYFAPRRGILSMHCSATADKHTGRSSLLFGLSGSTTNPPALAFATNIAGSEAPTLAYATVYPLTMLLRILCAQPLALILVR